MKKLLALILSSIFLVGCLPHYDRGPLLRMAALDLKNGVQFLESEFEASRFNADQQSATIIIIPETVSFYGLNTPVTELGVTEKAISVREFIDRAHQFSNQLQDQDFDKLTPEAFYQFSKTALKLQALGYIIAQYKKIEETLGHPFNNAAIHFLGAALADGLGKVRCVSEKASYVRFDGSIAAAACEAQNALSTLSEGPAAVSELLKNGTLPSSKFFDSFDEISKQLRNIVETAQAQREYKIANRAESLQRDIEFLRRGVSKIHSTSLDARDQMERIIGNQVETQSKILLKDINVFVMTGQPIAAKPQDLAPLKTSVLGLAGMLSKRQSTNPFGDTCRAANPYDCLARGIRKQPATVMNDLLSISEDAKSLTERTDNLCPVSPLCLQGKKLRDQAQAIAINMISMENNVAEISSQLQMLSNVMKSQIASTEANLRQIR